MKRCILIYFSLFPYIAIAQIITTIVGNGVPTSTGDGNPAIIATTQNPGGGAFDKQGNYYYAEGVGNKIRRIDVSGIITTVAGTGAGGFLGDGGQATAAQLSQPQGVKLDTAGNILIADAGNHRIRKVDKITGIISTIAGNGTGASNGDGTLATMASIWNPQDIAIDKKGNIYVAEWFSYKVRKIDVSGIITTFAGTGISGHSGDGMQATVAQVAYPCGLAIDDTGNLYIADPGSLVARVRKVDTFGIITSFAGDGGDSYSGDGNATSVSIVPLKITLDKFHNMYVADRYNHRVYKIGATTNLLQCIAGNGVAGDSGDEGAATGASIFAPTGVALDNCGNLYIPTAGNVSVPGSGNRIRKVTFNPTCNPAGVKEALTPTHSISLYPNPANTELTITATGKISSVVIVNAVGQVVCELKCNVVEKVEIDIRHLPSGVYYVKTNGMYSGKFLKE